MAGRVRRKAMREADDRRAMAAPPICALCGRPLGARVERHHVVPRSVGGRETVALHPICHRAIHAALSNAELAMLDGIGALRDAPALAAFLRWIGRRPPDFHAPTHTRN